jgi:hypothetical protein
MQWLELMMLRGKLLAGFLFIVIPTVVLGIWSIVTIKQHNAFDPVRNSDKRYTPGDWVKQGNRLLR